MVGDDHPCHGRGRESLRIVQPGASTESTLRSQQPTARPDRFCYQVGPETAEFRGWRGGESLTSQALMPEMTTDSVVYTFLFYGQISRVSCQPGMTSGWRLSTRSLPLAGRLRNSPPSSS